MQETKNYLYSFTQLLLPLLKSQMISAITITTIRIPAHMPALKIPPTTSQLLSNTSKERRIKEYLFFILNGFLNSLKKYSFSFLNNENHFFITLLRSFRIIFFQPKQKQLRVRNKIQPNRFHRS